MPAEGRCYSVIFENVAVTAAQDIFELSPADDKPIRILSWELTNVSDFGDAQEEVLRLEWIRGFTTSGSGGTAPTPRPANRSDAAAGFAAEVNNTTQATTGTTTFSGRAAGTCGCRGPRSSSPRSGSRPVRPTRRCSCA
jgi:hypothetical protein